MAKKRDLKKLRRSDLLELLVEYAKETERLNVALLEASEGLADLEARCAALELKNLELEMEWADAQEENIDLSAQLFMLQQKSEGAGLVGDEAMHYEMPGAGQAVDEIIAEGQAKADAIVEDARLEADAIVKEAEEEAAVIRKYAKMLLVDARNDAARVSVEVQVSSDELMAETRRKCSDLLTQAKAEIDALFDEADSRAARRWC